MTGALKLILGAAGVGLVGGAVAERLLTPSSMDRANAHQQWDAKHDEFLKSNPAPAGTSVFVGGEPQWKNAALVGGAAAGVGLLGGGLLFAATKMKPQNFPIGVTGSAMAALGAAALVGAGASYAIR